MKPFSLKLRFQIFDCKFILWSANYFLGLKLRKKPRAIFLFWVVLSLATCSRFILMDQGLRQVMTTNEYLQWNSVQSNDITYLSCLPNQSRSTMYGYSYLQHEVCSEGFIWIDYTTIYISFWVTYQSISKIDFILNFNWFWLSMVVLSVSVSSVRQQTILEELTNEQTPTWPQFVVRSCSIDQVWIKWWYCGWNIGVTD